MGRSLPALPDGIPQLPQAAPAPQLATTIGNLPLPVEFSGSPQQFQPWSGTAPGMVTQEDLAQDRRERLLVARSLE